MYDERGDFDFDIVNSPFLDGGVPSKTSYGVYISQLRARFHEQFFFGKDQLSQKLWQTICVHTQQRKA